jgi:predicted Zn-dependent protease
VRTAQLGGDLVYSYAGGVGIRTGDPQDVRRLTLAAAYHQAELDRKEGRPQDAASIVTEAARRFPNDPGVQMMLADSLLRDRGDAAAAQALMQQVKLPEGDARLKRRYDRLLESIRQKPASPAPAAAP